MKKNEQPIEIIETKHYATPLEKIDKNLSTIFMTNQITDSQITDSNQSLSSQIIYNSENIQNEQEQVKIDAEFVRSNLYDVIQNGKDALIYAIELAKQSDSPKAFEAVALLIKNLGDINLQLLDAQEKKQKIQNKNVQEIIPQKIVNNSIVFNGTTAELNKMLQQIRKEINET